MIGEADSYIHMGRQWSNLVPSFQSSPGGSIWSNLVPSSPGGSISYMMECERWKDERADIFKSLSMISVDFNLLTNDEKLFMILDQVLKIISKMWIVQFN